MMAQILNVGLVAWKWFFRGSGPVLLINTMFYVILWGWARSSGSAHGLCGYAISTYFSAGSSALLTSLEKYTRMLIGQSNCKLVLLQSLVC